MVSPLEILPVLAMAICIALLPLIIEPPQAPQRRVTRRPTRMVSVPSISLRVPHADQ